MEWHDHDWVEIPAGHALLGSDNSDPFASENEKPPRHVYLTRFAISRYPTTKAQLAAFLLESRNPHFAHALSAIQLEGESRQHFPATNVSWDLARAYCRWVSDRLGRLVELPSEAQWEKAARGAEGLIWPWGNIFDQDKCCSAESGRNDFCSVFDLPQGASPYGVMHMSGGVWEWCADFHHPGHAGSDLINPVELSIGLRRVVKGGSAFCTKEIVRPACRDWTNSVNQGGSDDGMRVILHVS